MAVSPDFRDFILEMLKPFGPVSFRPMFDGGGLYRTDLMFALITRSDVLYFRTDEQNTPDYIDAGMGPFVTNAEKKKTIPYHEVPAEILEDTEEMCAWAQKAFDAALRGKQGSKKGAQKKKPHKKKLMRKKKMTEPETRLRLRKRSILVAGHASSISLEDVFWRELTNIAKRQQCSLNQLGTEIDRTRTGNLSSAIRVFVLKNKI